MDFPWTPEDGPQEAHARWRVATRQLDLDHPGLYITAQKLTQSRQSLPARAMAIHDFVRRMPFAATSDGSSVRASEVLRRGAGDCHAKGVLFTALCRAAGLPARLLFVRVRTRFLHGILEGAPPEMPHAVGQVHLGERWVSTDGYVVDPLLFMRAKEALVAHGNDCGWGLVRDARSTWDGARPQLQQFRAEDVVRCHGCFHDPSQFYATQEGQSNGWLDTLKYALGAQLVNRRVAQLRRPHAQGPASRGQAA
ncbi:MULTISPECIES: transglutaminase-like domain-containing protein [Ramlibacter]|uniref:Transglutaminase domain-containing protein n=1 Tax=Ramlibacter aquaticus TaxID=2780094 RepID=A0ABR9SHY7_9BURK|nr:MULTISPECIES: transglutaminase-like domain-containing protein [Ramlibacter]MBE7941789.1 transglutaminase domain-containing protein [Ramlibacter aquaticus]